MHTDGKSELSTCSPISNLAEVPLNMWHQSTLLSRLGLLCNQCPALSPLSDCLSHDKAVKPKAVLAKVTSNNFDFHLYIPTEENALTQRTIVNIGQDKQNN